MTEFRPIEIHNWYPDPYSQNPTDNIKLIANRSVAHVFPFGTFPTKHCDPKGNLVGIARLTPQSNYEVILLNCQNRTAHRLPVLAGKDMFVLKFLGIFNTIAHTIYMSETKKQRLPITVRDFFIDFIRPTDDASAVYVILRHAMNHTVLACRIAFDDLHCELRGSHPCQSDKCIPLSAHSILPLSVTQNLTFFVQQSGRQSDHAHTLKQVFDGCTSPADTHHVAVLRSILNLALHDAVCAANMYTATPLTRVSDADQRPIMVFPTEAQIADEAMILFTNTMIRACFYHGGSVWFRFVQIWKKMNASLVANGNRAIPTDRILFHNATSSFSPISSFAATHYAPHPSGVAASTKSAAGLIPGVAGFAGSAAGFAGSAAGSAGSTTAVKDSFTVDLEMLSQLDPEQPFDVSAAVDHDEDRIMTDWLADTGFEAESFGDADTDSDTEPPPAITMHIHAIPEAHNDIGSDDKLLTSDDEDEDKDEWVHKRLQKGGTKKRKLASQQTYTHPSSPSCLPPLRRSARLREHPVDPFLAVCF